MKKIIVMLVFVAVELTSLAQSKQAKLYQEQIEANSVYMQYLKKAIAIARSGLTTISDLRNGEFKLHDQFFKALESVNPKIRSLSKVADIISCQVNIVKSYKSSYSKIKASGQFTAVEIEYIYKVFSKLLDDCANIILITTDVLSDDFYKMSDDERIKRIDILYANMQSNYCFCKKFANNSIVFGMQRLKEQNETAESKKLFNVY
jgi:hypothetical protein